jgi:cytochrome c556
MRRIIGAVYVAGIFGLALTGAALEGWAADMAKAIEYRQNVMKINGSSLDNIVLMIKGQVPFNAQQVVVYAETINSLSKIIPDLVPPGSGPEAGDTRAKPEIWQKMDEFKAAAAKLTSESAKLIEIAKGGDQAATFQQAAAMGKNGCGGCHEPFRKPKE